MTLGRYKGRFWAVYVGDLPSTEGLVCVCVYKKGAQSVIDRLKLMEELSLSTAILIEVALTILWEWQIWITRQRQKDAEESLELTEGGYLDAKE